MLELVDGPPQISNGFAPQDAGIVSERLPRNIAGTKGDRDADRFVSGFDTDVVVVGTNPDDLAPRFYATPPPVNVCLNL
jgi:hypothetical protein